MRAKLVAAGGAAVAAVAFFGNKVLVKRQYESFDVVSPTGPPWDHNWDRRCMESSIRPVRAGKPKDVQRFEREMKEKQPVAVRNLILIRHGSYHQDKKGKHLDELGIEQANTVGKYLKGLNLPISKIVWSTKPRATETGEIISKYFQDVPTQSCMLLEEGHSEQVPVPLGPADWEPTPWERHTSGIRIEAAFRKHFHRASPTQQEDSYEIYSCHGNVIRYCVMRALQLSPEAHQNLLAYNGSITWIQIAPNGRVNLLRFGDTGFIPPDKITLYGRTSPEFTT